MPDIPKVGQIAPGFTLPGVRGEEDRNYSLSDYRGRQNVLLFFYVFDWTEL